jgi:hypothetical protein
LISAFQGSNPCIPAKFQKARLIDGLFAILFQQNIFSKMF